MNISGNLLGGEVIQKFAELTEHNKTLKRLDYTDDSLTQFNIDTLLKSLTKKPTTGNADTAREIQS